MDVDKEEFPELHPPGPWLSILVFAVYTAAAIYVINLTESKWALLLVMPGYLIPCIIAATIHWNQKHAFAAKHGWRAVYRAGPHGHGSGFSHYENKDGIYMDPHTGEKVDADWNRRRGKDEQGRLLNQ